jgi:hypothetical protein
MYKSLTVVALALIVLTGAMGLRNVVGASAATVSATSLSAHATTGNGPFPPPRPGGGG